MFVIYSVVSVETVIHVMKSKRHCGSVFYLTDIFSPLPVIWLAFLSSPPSSVKFFLILTNFHWKILLMFLSCLYWLLAGQVGNVITNRNASRLEFERLLVILYSLENMLLLLFLTRVSEEYLSFLNFFRIQPSCTWDITKFLEVCREESSDGTTTRGAGNDDNNSPYMTCLEMTNKADHNCIQQFLGFWFCHRYNKIVSILIN